MKSQRQAAMSEREVALTVRELVIDGSTLMVMLLMAAQHYIVWG